MEMKKAPLSEAEQLYLRSRLPVPMVLLGFGIIGLIACVVVLIQRWPVDAYFFLAILILDLAATYVLWRVLRRQLADLRSGKKHVLPTSITRKFTRSGNQTKYFLEVGQKEYRVSPEAYANYAEGDAIQVYFTYFSRSWLGFSVSQDSNGEPS